MKGSHAPISRSIHDWTAPREGIVIPPEHILITGAAGTIGAAIARVIRKAWPQTRFALLDREIAPMQQLANEVGNASLHAVDLTDLDALPGVIASIEHGDGTEPRLPLDGLVNCAGVMVVRRIESWRWEDARYSLDVNLLAPLRLQDLVVPGMVARRRGLIVNISSMAGRVPLKGCTYYGASKAGLGLASEIARAELARHDVRVVTVYPGPVKSLLEQGARAGYGGGGAVGRIAPVGDPSVLAAKIMTAIDRDEPRVIYPRMYGLGWTAPNTAARIMLAVGPLPLENA